MAIDRRALAAIFAGGALGGAVRTGLAELAPTHTGHWPWITFSVNAGGSFLLGLLVTRFPDRLALKPYRRPFLATGFCSALTTFSAFQLELLKMLEHGDFALAAAYVVASLAAGLAGVALGAVAGRDARLTW